MLDANKRYHIIIKGIIEYDSSYDKNLISTFKNKYKYEDYYKRTYEYSYQIVDDKIEIEILDSKEKEKFFIFDDSEYPKRVTNFGNLFGNYYVRYLWKQVSDMDLYSITKGMQGNAFAILKFLGLSNLLNVVIKNKEDMFKHILKTKRCKQSNIDDILQSGQWSTKIECISDLELLGSYQDKTIYLCIDHIIDLFKELSEFDCEKWDDEFILFKKVFYHELGHLIFEKANNCKCVSKQTKERQANYIASDATNSLIDSYIEDITKLQPAEYHNPLLSFAHFVNKNKKEEFEFDELIEKYSEEVVKLFKGIK